jgi:hypothetical protein
VGIGRHFRPIKRAGLTYLGAQLTTAPVQAVEPYPIEGQVTAASARSISSHASSP